MISASPTPPLAWYAVPLLQWSFRNLLFQSDDGEEVLRRSMMQVVNGNDTRRAEVDFVQASSTRGICE